MVLKHFELRTTNKINSKQLNRDMFEIFFQFFLLLFLLWVLYCAVSETEKKQHQATLQ